MSPSSRWIGPAADAADPLGDQHRPRARRARSSNRNVNSSPPNRATVSIGRSIDCRRSRQPDSTRSPAAWPSESLTSLKLSTSRNRTAIEASPAARAVERDAEAVEEQRPVGQPGERVVQRPVGELDLRALALDRVAQRAPQQRRGELGFDTGSPGPRPRTAATASSSSPSSASTRIGTSGAAVRICSTAAVALLAPVQREQHAADRVVEQLVGRVTTASGRARPPGHRSSWPGASRRSAPRCGDPA